MFRKKHVHTPKIPTSACLQRSSWASLWISARPWARFSGPGSWGGFVWWHVIPSLIDIQYLQSFQSEGINLQSSKIGCSAVLVGLPGVVSHMFDQNWTLVQ